MSITNALPHAARAAAPFRAPWFDPVRRALRELRAGARRHQRLPELDAAMLRDLGLSHTLAAGTPRDLRGDRWP